MTQKPLRGAKTAQGYNPSPAYASCRNCANMRVLLTEPDKYGYVDQFRMCDIGKFKVALKGVCTLHFPSL